MYNLRNNRSNFVNSNHFIVDRGDNKALSFFYQNSIGQLFTKILISKPITKMMGMFYNSKFSKCLIANYVKRNHINMDEYKADNYRSFNDFFTRKKKHIKFSEQARMLCSPCDGYLSAYQISEDSTFIIKGISYSLEELLCNRSLAKKYIGGAMYVFRLMPNNYHRYHYFDEGTFVYRKKINGYFHTVRAVALEKRKVFVENSREYELIQTRNFKEVIYMEVGALGVGKIVNHGKESFLRGEEKGRFEFGGSTILLLFEKNVLAYDEKLFKLSLENMEAVVQCGCIVGEKR